MPNNNLYVFFQGTESNGALNYFTYSEGGWDPQQSTVTGASMSESPSAVVFTPGPTPNSLLYLFYQGLSSTLPNGQLMYQSSSDGQNWNPAAQVPDVSMTQCSPSAAVFPVGGVPTLYVFYQNSNQSNNGALEYVFSEDGDGWSGPFSIGDNQGTAVGSPSAVVFNGALYVFYQNNNPQGQVYYNYSTDGKTWNGPGVVYQNSSSGYMSTSPAAVVSSDNVLYALYQGATTNQQGSSQLWYATYYSDGLLDFQSWYNPLQVGQVGITQSPSAVIGPDGNLWCFHQGTNPPPNALWYTEFDGVGWSPDTLVNQASIATAGSPSAALF